MKSFIYRSLIIIFLSTTLFAGTFYVGQAGTPGGNYFTDIQSAVYAADDGDYVIVSNGTYVLSSEITVTNGLTIKSVNGSNYTIVDGNNSNRCFNLREKNIVISGFTITNGNSGVGSGGAIYCYEKSAEIKNCTIIGNYTVNWGGGVCYGNIINCKLIANTASYGGGSFKSIVSNSLVAFNFARSEGGGIYKGSINNCTVVGNISSFKGGGTSSCTNKNSIIYYNHAPDGQNIKDGLSDYCCTTPDGPSGTSNIFVEPVLVSATYIATNSPCIGAGLFAYAGGVDIDNEIWKNPPAIGCDEPYAFALLGSLSVSIKAQRIFTYVDIPLTFSADISGKLYKNSWDLDDGTTETDEFQVIHSWSETGKYNVGLTAYNNTYPAGVSGSVEVNIITNIHYVNINNPSPVLPYSTWETAATNIQDAVDIADNGGKIIVTNGMFFIYYRIYVDKSLVIESVNGPENTLVVGTNYGSIFYLKGSNIVVSGFTITNGYSSSGGGVRSFYPVNMITNCIIVGNRATDGAGVYSCMVNNSVISGNSADSNGGGTYLSTVNNCTFNGNSAQNGGGTYNSKVNNCIISDNTADLYGGGIYAGTADNCIIRENSAGIYGGGTSYGIINNSTISENTSHRFGGGTYFTTVNNSTISGNSAVNDGGGACYGILNNCIISGNDAEYGGGMYNSDGGSLTNCLIVGLNYADFGGGVYLSEGGVLYNCTIANNFASGSGGGIVCSNGGTVVNSIIYDNTALIGGGNWKSYASNILFSYSCTTPTNNLPIGNECFPDNPEFEVPASDYHLQETSPCRDTGVIMPWMAGATDLDGNPRSTAGTVDIGCYEFIPEPCFSLFIICQFLFIIRRFIK